MDTAHLSQPLILFRYNSGNTDTRFHWNNSKNIFRFTPSSSSLESSGIHTVDEHLLFDEHIRAVWFFHELVRNANEL